MIAKDGTYTDEYRAILAKRCQWLINIGVARTMVEASEMLAGPAGVWYAGQADAS